MSEGRAGVQVLERAIQIIDAIAESPQGLTAQALAERLDLTRPTIHRLLGALVDHGFLRRNRRLARYELGLRLVQLGRLAYSSLDLRHRARRGLADLVIRTRESASLAILDGTDIVIVDGFDGPGVLRPANLVGRRIPAHVTAAGRALLAEGGERMLRRYLEEAGWPGGADPDDPRAGLLREQLRRARRQGYAVEQDEFEIGMTSVAAVIRNHSGAAESALVLSGPSQRMSIELIEAEYGPLVQMNAMSISRELGWAAPEQSIAELEQAVEAARVSSANGEWLPKRADEGRNPMRNGNRILATMAGAALAAASVAAVRAEEMTLRYAHANTTSYPYHTAGMAFAERIAEETGGEITVELFPQGQLGGERDILEGIQLGTVDFQALSLGVLGNEIMAVNVLNLPFIFASAEHFIEVTTGEIGRKILRMAQEEGDAKGIKVLAIAGPMFRHPMNNVRPIDSVDDFRGLKFRTMEVPLHRDTYDALGATPVPLPFGEVYTALQTGVVDGNENGASALYMNRFHEVQKYVTELPVVSNSGALVMSAVTYDRLSEDQRRAVHDAARVWTEVMNRDGLAQEAAAFEAMAKAGIEVTHVRDVSAFVEATRPVYEKYMAGFSDEHRALVQEILASQRK